MGNAYSSIRGGSTAMFYNTAAMAYYDRQFDVSGGQVQWIANAARIGTRPEVGPPGSSLELMQEQALDPWEVEKPDSLQ